ENPLRCPAVGEFILTALVGGAEFERQRRLAAAALLGRVKVVLIGEKMLAGREQVGAEAPARRGGMGQPVSLQEPREERLRQILGGVVIAAAAADVAIDGEPVQGTQVGERLPGRLTVLAGGGDQAPARGGE